MTTNFDLCLPRALAQKHPHIRHVAEVNRGESDFNEFSLFAKAQIVWLHGKAEQYTDRNLIEETKTLDTALLEHLRPLLDATPLVVMGYRGAEDSIMQSLLGDTNQKFRQGVYWCTRGSEALHPNVEALKGDRSEPRGYAALNNGGVGLIKLAMLPGMGCLGASYFVLSDRSPLSTDDRTFSR